MKAVAIIYGWAEGPWQGRQFRADLEDRGFKVINDPSSADIIIAHSLGCYLVPNSARANKIMLIGLPYWPGRGSLTSVFLKLKGELSYHRKNQGLSWWLDKIAHNCWYILSRPRLTYYGLTSRRLQYLPMGSQVMLVRTRDDTFCHPNIAKLLPKYKHEQLPGAHDDCWFQPEPYIDLLGKEL